MLVVKLKGDLCDTSMADGHSTAKKAADLHVILPTHLFSTPRFG